MPDMPVADDPPELDSRGVVIMADEIREKLARMGIVATEPAGSVRPCGSSSHQPKWFRRPWPMGDMSCDICHPSLETLRAEGYPNVKRNLAPPKYVGRHINKDRKKHDRASSDLSGQVDPGTILFGNDV